MDKVLRGEEVRNALESGAVLYQDNGKGRRTYYWLESRTFPVPTPVVEDMVLSRTLDENDPEYDDLDEIGDELGYFITNYGSQDYLIYQPGFIRPESKTEETKKMDEVRTTDGCQKKKCTLEDLCKQIIPWLVAYNMTIVCKGPHGRRIIFQTYRADEPGPSNQIEYRCPQRDGQIIMFGKPFINASDEVDIYWWSAEHSTGTGTKHISSVDVDLKDPVWFIDKKSLNSSFGCVKEEFEALKEVYESMEQFVDSL